MKKIIENVKFMQDGTMVFGDLYLENGFVERIDYKTPRMQNDIVIPGFVDIHTHGFLGYTCDDTDPVHLKALAMAYASRGVTSFCPTLSARSLQDYSTIIEAYRMVFQGDYPGAQFAGFHLEGPYLNPEQRGNAPLANLSTIHMAELENFLATYHQDIRIMTIAPELEHASEAISLLHLYGVEVSLGHTNATFEQTQEAFRLGASQVTHLGNTMPMLHHRHESMIDAVFLSDCTCEIIMDRIHMQKEMLHWVIQLLGSERIIAVSDGNTYAGMSKFELPLDESMEYRNEAFYKGETLIGSCCDMLHIFRYLYKDAQYDLNDCLRMCCTNAAKMLRSYTYSISLGKKINLMILDHDMQIKDVIINGRSAI